MSFPLGARLQRAQKVSLLDWFTEPKSDPMREVFKEIPGRLPHSAILSNALYPPKTREWPWFAQAQAGPQRTTVVSPAFSAPAMLYEITIDYVGQSRGTVALLWSDNDRGAATNVAQTIIPPGIGIFDRPGYGSIDAPITPDALGGIAVHFSANHTLRNNTHRVRYPIYTRGNIFLKVSVESDGAGAVIVRGFCVLIEVQTFDELALLARN